MSPRANPAAPASIIVAGAFLSVPLTVQEVTVGSLPYPTARRITG